MNKLRAVSINDASSGPLDRECDKDTYEEILSLPVVEAEKPSPVGQYSTLQLLDGTKNVVQWYVSTRGGSWSEHGSPIVIVGLADRIEAYKDSK